ncbi:MAG TPA: polysaccharide biosynthesis/export family protein, partial [Puia sp.]
MRRSSPVKNFLFAIVGLWTMHTMSSCGTTKGLILVRGPFDTARLSIINPIEPVIRKGDILNIIVYSDNPEATNIYNQSLVGASGTAASNSVSMGTTRETGGSSPAAPGYEVDVDGNIIFQGIGKIKIEGLTRATLKDTLDARLSPYLLHPYYSIRFLNYKFTMMGEVAKPGIVNIPGERINILEAIALAGDLTLFADRDSVFIIRENNNKREFAWMNLTKPEIMASPYFYVQQNDIIIVEPNKKKSVANDIITARNVSLALAFIST